MLIFLFQSQAPNNFFERLLSQINEEVDEAEYEDDLMGSSKSSSQEIES